MELSSVSRRRPLTQACNTEQYSPCELEWADLEDRHTDSEDGRYLTHCDVGRECRDSTRPPNCDVTATFGKNARFEALQK